MRLAALFASTFAIFAFQCGGQIDGEQCPSSPNQACIQEGKACTFPMTQCGSQGGTQTCTCSNGVYDCPIVECPIEDCSLDTYPGSPCSKPGLQCEAMVQSQCTNMPTWCTCDGHQFQCAIPDCPPPPPPCPPPDSIVPGNSCSIPPDAMCDGPDSSQCFCDGTWECSLTISDGGAPDAPPKD